MVRSDDAVLYWANDEDISWQANAACLGIEDREMFFPKIGQDVQKAIDICEQCPVQVECLIYSYKTNTQGGVWGGMSSKKRLRSRRYFEDMGYLDD